MEKKNGKISEKTLSTIDQYIPDLLEENGQLFATEDHQSESESRAMIINKQILSN